MTIKEAATSTASRMVSQNACQSIKGLSFSGRFFLGIGKRPNLKKN
jgi:hypothetical protein